jgi:hypothetical protein
MPDPIRRRAQMQAAALGSKAERIPKRRQRHHSYDESLDEPPKLIAEETTDVETEVPAEENEPVERIEREDTSDTPAFEEE